MLVDCTPGEPRVPFYLKMRVSDSSATVADCWKTKTIFNFFKPSPSYTFHTNQGSCRYVRSKEPTQGRGYTVQIRIWPEAFAALIALIIGA